MKQFLDQDASDLLAGLAVFIFCATILMVLP